MLGTLCGCCGEDSPGEEALPWDPEVDKKRCEVFGCRRQAPGSYSIAPSTLIRLSRECAEREAVIIGALTEPIGNGKIRTKAQTQNK